MNVQQCKNILFFSFFLLSRPKLLYLLTKRIYLPVYVQYEWLKKFNVGTIIDIGANQGNVTLALAHICPQADIFAFEPIKKDYAGLKQKVKSFPNITAVNAALSNKNGTAPFFINAFSPSSSMLALTPLGEKITEPRTIKTRVRTVKLDTFFNDKKLKYPIFMKIDVQGAEHIVFEGGKEFLKHIHIIHVETGFETVYKDQCLFKDIYRILTKSGFIYHGTITDADFYPLFTIPYFENSLFIKKSIIKYVS